MSKKPKLFIEDPRYAPVPRVNGERKAGTATLQAAADALAAPPVLQPRQLVNDALTAGALSADYDAFGLIGTTFRELDWKTIIFFERAVPVSPSACVR